jgi:hypothetical protein
MKVKLHIFLTRVLNGDGWAASHAGHSLRIQFQQPTGQKDGWTTQPVRMLWTFKMPLSHQELNPPFLRHKTQNMVIITRKKTNNLHY